MPTTAATYTDVRKEVFDADTLNKMFYDGNPLLDKFEKVKRVVIGKRAHVPLHEQRAGATSVHDASGGTLNTASQEDVGVALYNLAYTWFPISLEFGALNEVTGGMTSVGEAAEHTISSALNNSRNQVTRQILTGDGFIAQCAAGGPATEVQLAAASAVLAGNVSGSDAVRSGWLVPGDVVDIGTTADTDTIVSSSLVTAVEDSLTTPSVTISSSVTTTTSHFVSLRDAYGTAGTGPLVESTGLNEIAGTTGNTVGSINGASVGHWNPAEVDSTSTVLDLDLLLRLSRRVKVRAGEDYSFCVTSHKQLDSVYALLQSQVRFTGDLVRAGESESTKWRGMDINAYPQVPENVFYFLTLKDLEMVFGAYDKPTWASDVEGSKRGAIWAAGTTRFDDAIVYATGLAARRRNSHAAAVNLNG
jgi:hypothetical protein